MSRTLFCLVSVLLLSLASTSYGDVVLGDFEATLDGWAARDATLAFSPIGATSNWLALQVTGPGGWHMDAIRDIKADRAALGVKGVTITADVTAFEADMTTTWMQVEFIINAQNNNDAGANNNIGWKGLGGQDIARDGLPHTYTWAVSDDLAAAIAGTDPNIGWFELVLVSNLDGASATKFYIDNIQIRDPAKKIAFISFHGADDAPSTGAVGVGFTTAVDKGYTDLLTANGYKVTRYVQSGTPDVNAINAADLVIVSRSVASTSFQNAGADTWNTQITKPLINLNGYTLRKSRLGFSTGTTLPDITGDIKLAVTDPNNPIFAGIALTDGVMDNPYAGLATYPTDGTKASGISVNTDPADANGIVLATIAAPADPNTPATGPAGGIVIAEWPAGVTVKHDGGAGRDVLAGRRLVFLSGSRENNSKSAETAGMFDLSEDGAKMFLNAVKYMLTPPPVPFVNLLTNGNFETGTSDTWGIWGSTFEVVTELVGAAVPEPPIEGTYCLHVTVPNATTNFWDTGMNTAPPTFEKDKKYTLSVWLKAKSGSVTVNLKPEHSADPWEGYGEKQVTMTDTWAEYSITTPPFATDVSPASITFHLGFGPAEFWVDNVRWYEGEYVKP
jgi:hypothetical protein